MTPEQKKPYNEFWNAYMKLMRRQEFKQAKELAKARKDERLRARENNNKKNGAKKTLKVKTGGKVPRKIFKGASKAPIAGPLMAVALVV